MQCVLIRKLVRDMNFQTAVAVVPTARESDGLAMSSRNVVGCTSSKHALHAEPCGVQTSDPRRWLQYLSTEQRLAAPSLYEALQALQHHFEESSKPVSSSELVSTATRLLREQPMFSHIDYVSIADRDTFEELEHVTEKGAVASVAVGIGSLRLLDNIIL